MATVPAVVNVPLTPTNRPVPPIKLPVFWKNPAPVAGLTHNSDEIGLRRSWSLRREVLTPAPATKVNSTWTSGLPARSACGQLFGGKRGIGSYSITLSPVIPPKFVFPTSADDVAVVSSPLVSIGVAVKVPATCSRYLTSFASVYPANPNTSKPPTSTLITDAVLCCIRCLLLM